MLRFLKMLFDMEKCLVPRQVLSSRIKVMQVFGNPKIIVADHSQVKDLDWCTLIC